MGEADCMSDTPILKFGYDQHSDGVFVSLDGAVLWWEQTFDSVDQFLAHGGVPRFPVLIQWGESTPEEYAQLRELLGDEDEDE